MTASAFSMIEIMDGSDIYSRFHKVGEMIYFVGVSEGQKIFRFKVAVAEKPGIYEKVAINAAYKAPVGFDGRESGLEVIHDLPYNVKEIIKAMALSDS